MGDEVLLAMGPFRLTRTTLNIDESTYAVASIDGVQIEKPGLGADLIVMPLCLLGGVSMAGSGAPLASLLVLVALLVYAVQRSRRRVLFLLMNGARVPVLVSRDQPSMLALSAAFASAKSQASVSR